MEILAKALNSLKVSDLTYVTVKSGYIRSLVGIEQQEKEYRLLRREDRFMQNIKALRTNHGKTDRKNFGITKTTFKHCVTLLTDILKIMKAGEVDGQDLKHNEEFENYIVNHSQDVVQFLDNISEIYVNTIAIPATTSSDLFAKAISDLKKFGSGENINEIKGIVNEWGFTTRKMPTKK
jgi:hypothetical protein